jgi:hypothetical protein
VLVLLENSRRQTDGVRSCTSRYAVLDPDMKVSHVADDTSPIDACWRVRRLEECELSLRLSRRSTLTQPTIYLWRSQGCVVSGDRGALGRVDPPLIRDAFEFVFAAICE